MNIALIKSTTAMCVCIAIDKNDANEKNKKVFYGQLR